MFHKNIFPFHFASHTNHFVDPFPHVFLSYSFPDTSISPPVTSSISVPTTSQFPIHDCSPYSPSENLPTPTSPILPTTHVSILDSTHSPSPLPFVSQLE